MLSSTNNKISNVAVIIRSAFERTESLCRHLVEQQVKTENIVVIHERPFSQAVRRSFAIGIDYNLDWTVCIDADVLIKDDSIRILISELEALKEPTFGGSGYLVDKLMGYKRQGAPHVHRTQLLPQALSLVPEASISLRPETYVHNHMEHAGYVWKTINHLVSLHAYEQYFRDIYRTMVVRAQKSPNQSGQLIKRFSRYRAYDTDFWIALSGIVHGATLTHDEIDLDAKQWEEKSKHLLNETEVHEKSALRIQDTKQLANDLIHKYEQTSNKYLQDCILAGQSPHIKTAWSWYRLLLTSKIKQILGK